MNEILERLDVKLDALVTKVHEVDKTLTRQEANLQEHMRRTEAAEASLELLRKEFKPVKKFHEGLKFLLATLGATGLMAGAVASIMKLFNIFP